VISAGGGASPAAQCYPVIGGHSQSRPSAPTRGVAIGSAVGSSSRSVSFSAQTPPRHVSTGTGAPVVAAASGLPAGAIAAQAPVLPQLAGPPGANSRAPLRRSPSGMVLIPGTMVRQGQLSAVPAPVFLPLKTTELLCPRGHAMSARVTREMLRKWDSWRYEIKCDECDRQITTHDARYTCTECDYDFCMSCAEEQMRYCPASPSKMGQQVMHPAMYSARPVNIIQAGDIMMAGPDTWGIHHAMLVTGPMYRDPEAGKLLRIPGSAFDVWACKTIESTRALQGEDTLWYPSTTFFKRNLNTGVVSIVADFVANDNAIEQAQRHVPCKVLLHPLRLGHGGPFFLQHCFEQAIQSSAEDSTRWSLRSAVKAIMATKDTLHEDDYPDELSRLQLLEELKRRWTSRPICSAVAIIVWQKYFGLACEHNGLSQDIAVQCILKWMPVLSDRTSPSALVQSLTSRGWILHESFGAV